MKKTVISIATAFALLITMAMPCFASENTVEKEYEYYGNGSYAVIETFIDTPTVPSTLHQKARLQKVLQGLIYIIVLMIKNNGL